ncbi:hypothetical protein [Rheinheimera sp.]|uniref:hypothetical protein n=1 Tax=Rheinheimera sp. TaxID=1869214 RepID=UPI00307DA2C0
MSLPSELQSAMESLQSLLQAQDFEQAVIVFGSVQRQLMALTPADFKKMTNDELRSYRELQHEFMRLQDELQLEAKKLIDQIAPFNKNRGIAKDSTYRGRNG